MADLHNRPLGRFWLSLCGALGYGLGFLVQAPFWYWYLDYLGVFR